MSDKPKTRKQKIQESMAAKQEAVNFLANLLGGTVETIRNRTIIHVPKEDKKEEK